MSLFQWLSLAGIPGMIVLIGGIVINRALKKRDKKQQEIADQNLQLEAQNRATMLGVQALLRDRLLQAFQYHISQGCAEYSERENVLNMYTNYEALGPNSVMEDLYNQFKTLPMQK